MELENAITAALEFETRIRDMYNDAAARVGDAEGEKIFRALADDEQRHVDYLQHRLEEWRRDGELSVEILASAIPDKAAIQKAADRVQRLGEEDNRGLKQQMLSRALAMELETSRFYRNLVDRIAPAYQAMFSRFLEIEDNHVEAVQFELDHLSRTGFWFGFEEIDMEQM